MSKKNYYNNKTVFIVGGSSGIGLATAQLLLRQGANVCIFARRENLLQQALASLKQGLEGRERLERLEGQEKREQDSQQLSYRCLDVIDEADVEVKFACAVSELGLPDIMINCAGAATPNYFENISAQQFEQTLRLNVLGVRNVSAAVLPYMKQTRGQIINTSSIAGFIGVFGYTDYSASKFAIVGFSEALRQEVRPHGVNVSVLYPPDTLTAGFEQEEKTKPKETRAISANAKLLTPEQVAQALVKKIPKARFHIIPTLDGQFSHLMKRWLPSLVDYVMARSIRNS
jgi:short-subunit dehydrogenase